jgi:hypothetical protein
VLKTFNQLFFGVHNPGRLYFLLACFISFPFERIPVTAKLNLCYYLEGNESTELVYKKCYSHAAFGKLAKSGR